MTDELTITRVFDAPREEVWKAWTEPDIFKKWWGPKGFTSPVAKINPVIDGEYLNSMRSPQGQEFWSKGTFHEVIPTEKLVMTDSFSDSEGNIVPATYYGLSENFPQEMLITITFEDEIKPGKNQSTKTKLTLLHSGIENISVQDRKNMEQGWNESFDKLADILER